MERSFTIDEILSAVDEIQNKKKEIRNLTTRENSNENIYSTVPKNTLKIIEEAEKNYKK